MNPFILSTLSAEIFNHNCTKYLKINIASYKNCQLCYQTDTEVAKHHVASGHADKHHSGHHSDKHHSSHADKHHGSMTDKQTNLSSLEVKGEKVR